MSSPDQTQRSISKALVVMALVLISTACAGSSEPNELRARHFSTERVCAQLEDVYSSAQRFRVLVAEGDPLASQLYEAYTLNYLYANLAANYRDEPSPHFTVKSLSDFRRTEIDLVAAFTRGKELREDIEALEASAQEVHSWSQANCSKIDSADVDLAAAADVLASAPEAN